MANLVVLVYTDLSGWWNWGWGGGVVVLTRSMGVTGSAGGSRRFKVGPINNILVRQQLPPPPPSTPLSPPALQLPPPNFSPDLPPSCTPPSIPAEWAPLITGLGVGKRGEGGGGVGCTMLLSYGALSHLLPPFVGHPSFSMQRVCLGGGAVARLN